MEQNTRTNGLLMKTRLPLLVPAFNNPYYVGRFCNHILKFDCFDIIIFDNNSTYPPMREFYSTLPNSIKVLYLSHNFGPRIFWMDDTIYNSLPDIFSISDPDIEFNDQLPTDFIDRLIDLTFQLKVGKIGFALDIFSPHIMTQRKFRHADGWKDIWESEGDHWQREVKNCDFDNPLYIAPIDTTFAIYNKNFFNRDYPFSAIRVGGHYIAKHLPWYINVNIPEHEQKFYQYSSVYSYYSSDNTPIQLRSLFELQDKIMP